MLFKEKTINILIKIFRLLPLSIYIYIYIIIIIIIIIIYILNPFCLSGIYNISIICNISNLDSQESTTYRKLLL